MKRGKKYLAALEKVEPNKKYALDEAVAKLKEIAFAKFDETVELTMWLGVDPRKADQLVRGTIVLPHGLGGSASTFTPLMPALTRHRVLRIELPKAEGARTRRVNVKVA